jgi:hypothetical protein
MDMAIGEIQVTYQPAQEASPFVAPGLMLLAGCVEPDLHGLIRPYAGSAQHDWANAWYDKRLSHPRRSAIGER